MKHTKKANTRSEAVLRVFWHAKSFTETLGSEGFLLASGRRDAPQVEASVSHQAPSARSDGTWSAKAFPTATAAHQPGIR